MQSKKKTMQSKAKIKKNHAKQSKIKETMQSKEKPRKAKQNKEKTTQSKGKKMERDAPRSVCIGIDMQRFWLLLLTYRFWTEKGTVTETEPTVFCFCVFVSHCEHVTCHKPLWNCVTCYDMIWDCYRKEVMQQPQDIHALISVLSCYESCVYGHRVYVS
jgi:hypothetical protein